MNDLCEQCGSELLDEECTVCALEAAERAREDEREEQARTKKPRRVGKSKASADTFEVCGRIMSVLAADGQLVAWIRVLTNGVAGGLPWKKRDQLCAQVLLEMRRNGWTFVVETDGVWYFSK